MKITVSFHGSVGFIDIQPDDASPVPDAACMEPVP